MLRLSSEATGRYKIRNQYIRGTAHEQKFRDKEREARLC